MSTTEKQVIRELDRNNRKSQTKIKTASADLLETQTKQNDKKIYRYTRWR